MPPKYSIALALHCAFRLPHAPLTRPSVLDGGPVARPAVAVFEDLNQMEDIMTEEQYIAKARAEEDRWEEIERQIAEMDEAEEDRFGEPDPEIEALVTALGY